jgi:hypothetical protein
VIPKTRFNTQPQPGGIRRRDFHHRQTGQKIMSAHIVSDICIHRIAPLFFNTAVDCLNYDEIGRQLLALNTRSVNARYSTSATPPDYRYSPRGRVSDVQRYKALKSWLYQSCEGDCDRDDLYKRAEAISDLLAAKIVQDSPAYSAAEW